MRTRWIRVLFQPFLLCLLLSRMLFAGATEEWPQYRGVNRDGVSAEKGVLTSWPQAGPKALWRTAVGDGYSGIAVARGRVFTMDARDQDEFIVCMDAASGKEVWRVRIDSTFMNDQGNGPRSTPTVDGNLTFALSGQGTLYAAQAGDGKKVWSHNLVNEYATKIPNWGFSSSPLVEGDLLILPAGSGNSNAVLAFDKKTGALIWKSQTDEPGYSSPIAITVNGIRQIIVLSGTMLFSLSPADGKLYWKYPWKTDYFVNAAVPIFIAPDKIFISTGYSSGAALLRINASKTGVTVQELWLSKGLKNHFNSSVLHAGHIYGFDNAILKCIDAATGEEKWKKSGFGKGSLLLADGHLLVLSERGLLVLVEATPSEYKEKASAEVLKGKCWTMPTLAGGKLYLRNQKELVCLDVTGKV